MTNFSIKGSKGRQKSNLTKCENKNDDMISTKLPKSKGRNSSNICRVNTEPMLEIIKHGKKISLLRRLSWLSKVTGRSGDFLGNLAARAPERQMKKTFAIADKAVKNTSIFMTAMKKYIHIYDYHDDS
eukprot:CAMPEP_0117848644 /NCGR_PEP_ID=MMETSP0949-20121206/20557_1 /TAXON_ID=44440 /ORGANISM="Chattonella subsalsa, Strain CCMP2191" /LENGTH=127 /DNA_ID=CAMNT_0005695571 /DNA_START=1063 /DNA_END=1446 /DNA_ORIENTATION=+